MSGNKPKPKNSDLDVCGVCNGDKDQNAKSKWMACENEECNSHFHRSCVGLSRITEADLGKLSWDCPSCVNQNRQFREKFLEANGVLENNYE